MLTRLREMGFASNWGLAEVQRSALTLLLRLERAQIGCNFTAKDNLVLAFFHFPYPEFLDLLAYIHVEPIACLSVNMTIKCRTLDFECDFSVMREFWTTFLVPWQPPQTDFL